MECTLLIVTCMGDAYYGNISNNSLKSAARCGVVTRDTMDRIEGVDTGALCNARNASSMSRYLHHSIRRMRLPLTFGAANDEL